MAVQILTLDQIHHVDHGSVVEAVNLALKAAFVDCSDRPEVNKPRKITLEIAITPIMHERDFRYADVDFTIKTSAPAKGVTVRMRPSDSNVALEFQSECKDNPDQKPLFEKGGE